MVGQSRSVPGALKENKPCFYHQAMLLRQRLLGQKDETHLKVLYKYANDHDMAGDFAGFIATGQFCLDWVLIQRIYFYLDPGFRFFL